MPRKARIDAPGVLHHIVARGIERRSIFEDDTDRKDFLNRLDTVLSETQTTCYAWALVPNHIPPSAAHRAIVNINRYAASVDRLRYLI